MNQSTCRPWLPLNLFRAFLLWAWIAANVEAAPTVFHWGDSSYGQRNLPAGLEPFVRISAGSYHTLGLRPDGTVAAWGYDSVGQIDVPAGLDAIAAIRAASFHSLALRTNGTVVAWGDGVTVPLTLSNVVSVSGGWGHDVALLKNGSLVVWGGNGSGQMSVPSD